MYQLRKLHAVHREVIRLRASGLTNMNIANELGVTQAFVGLVLNSELGKLAMEEMQSKMDAEVIEVGVALQQNAKLAEAFLGKVVVGEEKGVSPALRARVCMDQLDRAGFGKITKNLNVDFSGALTAQEIAEIKAEGRRMVSVVNTAAGEED
jgi:hypothetical protein